jgi:hypothetical protein
MRADEPVGLPEMLLEELLGNRVVVYSRGADDDSSDEGILDAYEYPWIKLRKNKDVLCFPVFQIRLIKLVKRIRPEIGGGERRLLRPVMELPAAPEPPND